MWIRSETGPCMHNCSLVHLDAYRPDLTCDRPKTQANRNRKPATGRISVQLDPRLHRGHKKPSGSIKTVTAREIKLISLISEGDKLVLTNYVILVYH